MTTTDQKKPAALKHTPRELLQECMESAVRLAFIRHSEDIEFDADADTQEEIANDAACACFAEGTCTEEPIKEVVIALKRLEAFDDMLAALKAQEPLMTTLCSLALKPEIDDYLPSGLKEQVKAWLRENRDGKAISKAERGQ